MDRTRYIVYLLHPVNFGRESPAEDTRIYPRSRLAGGGFKLVLKNLQNFSADSSPSFVPTNIVLTTSAVYPFRPNFFVFVGPSSW